MQSCKITSSVRFEIGEIDQVGISGSEASAIVGWFMQIPDSTGQHVHHFGLVKLEAGWRIATEEFVSEKNGRKLLADLPQLYPILYALDNCYYQVGALIGVGYQEAVKLKGDEK
jgi:hypothetical protein